MKDHPASWRMPTEKQMAKLKPPVGREPSQTRPTGPGDDMPPEYWEALLSDPRADARPSGVPIQQRRLSEISLHVLRVTCRRCERVVEIQTADAQRMYGPEASWREVGQRLLENTCRERTGSHEDDGCWPSF